jgi:membrane-bound ClpP family serine protease
MTLTVALRGLLGFFEHAAAVIVGLVLMILGLGLGITMIMLPVGVVVGLIGFAMVVAGLFARIDKKRDRP